MKKLYLPVKVLTLSLSVLLVSTGCNNQSDDVTQAFTFDPVPDQYDVAAINIGSIVNTPSVRDAILLAAEQINQAGGVLGKNLNVVAFVANSADDAVKQAEKLLEYDIKALSVSYSSRSKAVSELTIPKNIPLISESATSPFFTDYSDNDFYFRVVPSDIIQSRILAELAIENGKEKVITVHNETDQYGETLVEYFTVNFEALGGQVIDNVVIPFSVTTGFDSYLEPILASSPDLILNVILEGGIAANFVNEAVSTGVQASFLLPDSSAGVASFANNIVDVQSISDALGTAAGFGLVSNPEMIFFDESYQEQFARQPESFNVTGYDLVMVTALAIEHAGLINNTDDPTGIMVRDSLRAVMNPPGEKVGPANITQALQLIRSGIDVDYSGSYGDNDWDIHGDLVGEITYNVLSLDSDTKLWKTVFQRQTYIPLVP